MIIQMVSLADPLGCMLFRDEMCNENQMKL